jgi:hypothetical protein
MVTQMLKISVYPKSTALSIKATQIHGEGRRTGSGMCVNVPCGGREIGLAVNFFILKQCPETTEPVLSYPYRNQT